MRKLCIGSGRQNRHLLSTGTQLSLKRRGTPARRRRQLFGREEAKKTTKYILYNTFEIKKIWNKERIKKETRRKVYFRVSLSFRKQINRLLFTTAYNSYLYGSTIYFIMGAAVAVKNKCLQRLDILKKREEQRKIETENGKDGGECKTSGDNESNINNNLAPANSTRTVRFSFQCMIE